MFFQGFSIIFIGYVIMNILTNYPPREIGISPEINKLNSKEGIILKY